MKHPRMIDFTNAEIANFTDHQAKLKTLSDFLWNDPRPAQEGKFEMDSVATGWNEYEDDPKEALSRCGTAACACGWAALVVKDNDMLWTSMGADGPRATNWMFGGCWSILDNTPFGASFRIDHWLKNQEPALYECDGLKDGMARHYPKPTPWLQPGFAEAAA